jgi:hypothetical protein
MMVLVVNEVVRGGWLEFLARVEFDDKKEFDIKQEMKRNVRGNARAVLEQERKNEMREKAEEVSQRHQLGDTEQGKDLERKKGHHDDAMGIKQKQDYDACLRSGVWDTSPSDSIRGIGRSIEEISTDGFMPLQNLENDVPDYGYARDSQAQSVEMKEADLDVEGVADWLQTVIPGDLGKQYAAGLRDGLIDSDGMDSFPVGGDELTEYGIEKKHCRAILAKWGKRKSAAVGAGASVPAVAPTTSASYNPSLNSNDDPSDLVLREIVEVVSASSSSSGGSNSKSSRSRRRSRKHPGIPKWESSCASSI